MSHPQKKTVLAATAHHEAGHAVIAYRNRIAFTEVTIKRTEAYLGIIHTPLTERFFSSLEYGQMSDGQVQRHVLVFLAGAEAEKRFRGRYNHVGARQDRSSALELVQRHAGSSEERNALLRLFYIRARQAVHHAWAEVEVVARALLERETLSGRVVRALIRQHHRDKNAALLQSVRVMMQQSNDLKNVKTPTLRKQPGA